MLRKRKEPTPGKRRYVVYGVLHVGVVTVVDAASADEAKELAADSRDTQSLCHQCVGGDYHEEWSLCDGLNGEVEVGDAEVEDG